MGIHRKNEKHPGFPTGIESMGGLCLPPPLASFLSGGAPHGVCVWGGEVKKSLDGRCPPPLQETLTSMCTCWLLTLAMPKKNKLFKLGSTLNVLIQRSQLVQIGLSGFSDSFITQIRQINHKIHVNILASLKD